MERTERQALLATLGRMHHKACYWAARLSARPATATLSFGVAARAKAIQVCLERDTTWAIAATRLRAEFGATLERLSELRKSKGTGARLLEWELRLQHLAEQDGALRAERSLLDARLSAEHRAFLTTWALLQIRMGRPTLNA
ncbi:MAG: hypothetical protein IPG45_31235 [Deltaproteobacteria bacterium]|nr:hypothetical protein [Deltaproteobacteria bacterium]